MNKLENSLTYWLIIVAVLLAIIGGFRIVGSPEQERNRRLDEQRINDLKRVQQFINLYSHRHHVIPQSLLVDSSEQGYWLVSKDPETGKPYEYLPLDDKNYELCAHFSGEGPHTTSNNLWSHLAGRQCFKLKIEAE